jgi:hypothetical protein
MKKRNIDREIEAQEKCLKELRLIRGECLDLTETFVRGSYFRYIRITKDAEGLQANVELLWARDGKSTLVITIQFSIGGEPRGVIKTIHIPVAEFCYRWERERHALLQIQGFPKAIADQIEEKAIKLLSENWDRVRDSVLAYRMQMSAQLVKAGALISKIVAGKEAE